MKSCFLSRSRLRVKVVRSMYMSLYNLLIVDEFPIDIVRNRANYVIVIPLDGGEVYRKIVLLLWMPSGGYHIHKLLQHLQSLAYINY